MFKECKYTTWYFKIIENSKLNTKTGYTERHHIIPKSFGGSDKKENLAILSGREHFICHLLLTKMTEGQNRHKMLHAFMLMKGKNKRDRYVNNRLFNAIRKEFGAMISAKKAGSKHTQETKDKIRNTLKSKPSPISDEGRKSISEKAKARIQIPKTDEYKKKMSEAMKLSHQRRGHKMSDDHKSP